MYQPRKFQLKGLKYRFSEVSDGNLSFIYGDGETVKNNREIFLKKLIILPEQSVAMFLRHGDNIVKVSKAEAGNIFDEGKILECDAMVTTEKNLALFLLIADCIPMIITDTDRSVLSIVHAGITNTKIELPRKVVELITRDYRINPKNLEIIIGPSLRKENFIYEYFDDKDSDIWKGFVEETGNGKFMIDNVGAVIKQLRDCGIKEENIHDCKIDTYTDERFFSHKRDYDNGDKDKGRFAAVAMLE